MPKMGKNYTSTNLMAKHGKLTIQIHTNKEAEHNSKNYIGVNI